MSVMSWHEAPWQRLVARAAGGSLPHALLLSGAAGTGKRQFAERFIGFLLCENPASAPCGSCRSCRLYAVRSQRDPEETRPDGSAAHPHGLPGHPDAKFVGYGWNERQKKMYGEIVVDQIRELSQWLHLTPQCGRAQAALIEPAEAMNAAAANALLKTLEEPSAGRHLLLVTAHPARLPATIRSRCQRIEFDAPSVAASLPWLVGHGLGEAEAAAALEAAAGSPGLALAWARDGRGALRQRVADDLRALRQRRAGVAEVAAEWARTEPAARLWFASSLVQAEAGALARHERGPLALTATTDLTKLSAWFDRTNRARDLLRGPVRADLVLVELLMAWQAMA